MKILITGGSGFVGKNLHESLRKSYDVIAPSSRDLNLLDYSKLESYIKKEKPNIIINAAVRGGTTVLDNTLRMFAGLMRVVGHVDKIIHFGSGAEYAKTRDLIKVKETDWGEYIPKDDYGLAKYMIHHIVRNEKKIVNLRLFGIYGKYEDYRYKFISNSIVKTLLNLPIAIKQDVVFDYLYIDDLLPIVQYFIEHNWQHSSYNITPKESISLKSLVNKIITISKSTKKMTLINEGLNYQYTASNDRLIAEIPNLKFTSYDQGLKKLYKYYKSIRNNLDKEAILQDNYLARSKIKH